MRKLKTPEEIMGEDARDVENHIYTSDDVTNFILTAQRDALECVNTKLNKMDKVENDITINADDREAYTLGLNQLEQFILNIIPK